MLIISPKTRRRHEMTRRGLLTGAAALSMFEKLQLSDAQAQSPCGSFYPTVPTPAAAEGYSLVYADDFNVPGTLAPNTTVTSGYNIYPNKGFNVTTATDTTGNGNGTLGAHVTAFTSATAAGITNKNTGGGSFASPNNGILTLSGPNTNGFGGVATVTTTATSTQRNGVAGAAGTFKSFYAQAYLQFQPLFVCPGQWSALVFYVQNTTVAPGQTLQCSEELDWMECSAGNNGFTGNLSLRMTTSGHCWNTSTQVFSGGQTYNGPVGGSGAALETDNNFHLFGYLKKSTGTNTGSISVYYDNVLQTEFSYTGPFLTGPGGTPTTGWNWAELFEYFFALSACYGSTANSASVATSVMNVDYIQVFA